MNKPNLTQIIHFLNANKLLVLSFTVITLILTTLIWYFGKFLLTPQGSAFGTLITLVTGFWFFWDKITAFVKEHQQSSCTVEICTPTQLETPSGCMRLDSPFYIERPPIETDCYAEILKPSTLIRIKAPRQMGKTSLLRRILHHAQQVRTVEISFQETDADCFEELGKFLKWFCCRVAENLEIEPQIEQHWSDDFPNKINASNYFERYLLTQITEPIVIGLDEVDCLFPHESVAKEVFSLWRNWHEKGKTNTTWERVHLIIVHSQVVYVPLHINESPFNVGLAIQLPEFTLEQIEDLAKRHGLTWSNEKLTQLMQLVGGHPFLVRQAFYKIARGEITLAKLLKTAHTEEGIYGEHLRHHLLTLKEFYLDHTMKQIVQSQNSIFVDDTEQTFKLRSMGLIKYQENNVIPACDLYRLYFRSQL